MESSTPDFKTTEEKWVKVNEYSRKRVKGVTLKNRQRQVRAARPGMNVVLKREPKNKYDPNAISVYIGGKQVGYLDADVCKWAAKNIDSGKVLYKSKVAEVWSFEGDEGRTVWMMDITFDRYEKQSVEVFSAGQFLVWHTRRGIASFAELVGRGSRWGGKKVVEITKWFDSQLLRLVGDDQHLLWIIRSTTLIACAIGFWVAVRIVW